MESLGEDVDILAKHEKPGKTHKEFESDDDGEKSPMKRLDNEEERKLQPKK